VLEAYKVVYRGGLANLPKPKVREIILKVKADAIELEPTNVKKNFWDLLTIPYSTITDITITACQVSTVEGLLGGINSRQLNQDNNIHIDYVDASGNSILLRLEMLTGITVMGQAGKAREFNDRLRVHGVREKFRKTGASVQSDGIPSQIMKLAELRDAGVLTEDEFTAKKAELLARL
jgi:hypothetical protein